MSEILAYSAEHVCRLTGLTPRQLGYWDDTAFFRPQYADELRRRPFGRIYSFRDLVNLRVVALLRKDYGIALQELRGVGARLSQSPESSWAMLTLFVSGSRVFFEDPDTGARMAARPRGQIALPIAMSQVAKDMRNAAKGLRERAPDQFGRIGKNRYVAQNDPVLSGTRIPTSAVWNLHQAGYSPAAIIAEFPRLTLKDVSAAIAFEEQRRLKRAG